MTEEPLGLPLDPVIMRLELLSRLLDVLEKQGHARDLVADDPASPYFTLGNDDRDYSTYAGEILVAWHVSVAERRTGRRGRTEWWYMLSRYLELDDGSELADPKPSPIPVVRCRDLYNAARIIDNQIKGRVLLSQIYGRGWFWWHGQIRPYLQILSVVWPTPRRPGP
jgi:hypothetical protein